MKKSNQFTQFEVFEPNLISNLIVASHYTSYQLVIKVRKIKIIFYPERTVPNKIRLESR